MLEEFGAAPALSKSAGAARTKLIPLRLSESQNG